MNPAYIMKMKQWKEYRLKREADSHSLYFLCTRAPASGTGGCTNYFVKVP